MARVKGDHQKLKLLYLAKIFEEETDDEHRLTLPQIAQMLAACGVNADRKTLYQDFEELRSFGMDIISEREGRDTYYWLGVRDFELSELKLLVDSVQSAKFITDGKSRELIGKLEKLASRHQAGMLQRQVMIAGRIKTMNESIYYNVDKLHTAIGGDVRIRFQYFQWNVKKEMQLRRDGAWYEVSPWGLLMDDENYYLVGYDAGTAGSEGTIKHYRVDKMLHITVTDLPRQGRGEFESFDMPRYTKTLFSMFGGEETKVTLEAEDSMAGILIDRFGKDLIIVKTDEDHFRTSVSVAVSSQFFGWILALEGKVRIAGPAHVARQMKKEAEKIAAQYG
ncbi:MAG: WYL domain-containing protein [Lachnospiraceae bacterium]|nr:WYL domain-containing protein [Lachnospiraceae bacterium]